MGDETCFMSEGRCFMEFVSIKSFSRVGNPAPAGMGKFLGSKSMRTTNQERWASWERLVKVGLETDNPRKQNS